MNRLLRPSAAQVVTLVVVALAGNAVAAASVPARASGQDAHVVPAESWSEVPEVRPGELIVKRAPGQPGRGIDRALSRVRGRAATSIGRGLSVVSVAPGSEEAAADALAADPAVAYAEPNYVRTSASHPDEHGWGIDLVRAAPLWDRAPALTGAGVRVAVLDSGVDNHPQLRGRLAPGFDTFGGNGRDNCGHGTAVAGVVGAAHDGRETVGVAPEATIVPVKVLDYDQFFGSCVGDDAGIVRGIQWAVSSQGGDADIINLSLSGPHRSAALEEAIAAASAAGVLVVAAAGNAGDRVPNYPAAYPTVVSVGGLQRGTSGAQWWPLSSFGSVDIAAPAKTVPLLLAARVPSQRVGRPCPSGDTPQGLCSDGTSFASPYVVGVAALLLQQHADVPKSERAARLRQLVLGSALDLAPTGVDLRTGHGHADADAAARLIENPDGLVVTWEAGERVLSPTARMHSVASALPLAVVVTDGLGRPVADQPVSFAADATYRLSAASAVTDASGRAATQLRSTAAGTHVSVRASAGDRSLAPLQTYVLYRNDNIPGIKLPLSPVRGSLDVVYDVDDVFRVKLFRGETLRARLLGVDQRREFLDLYLHAGNITDVTNPERAPLREDSTKFAVDPVRLKYTAPTDGVRYLDVFGLGSYRMRWWILSPGKVDNARARPSTFTPDGDGRADRTTIKWRNRRAGAVVLRIRNSNGKVVRRANLRRLPRGRHTFDWDGRNKRGSLASSGRYRVVVRWENGRGRISKTTTRVTLRR